MNKTKIFSVLTGKVALFFCLFLISAFALLPILYTVLASFKTRVDLFTFPPALIFKPTLDHWTAVLTASDFLLYYKNSLVISIVTVAIVILVASLAGYSLARFTIKRKEDLAFWMLSQSMIPAVAIILPLYVLFSRWRLLDTFRGIILVYSAFNIPFAVWLMRSFFNDIPVDVEEAALVDGCSRLGVFWRISLPLVKPGLIACTIYTFVMCINEFFLAFVLTGMRVRPAAVAVVGFLPTGVRGTLYGQAAVAALLIMSPAVIFFYFAQKYLISGLTMGAIR